MSLEELISTYGYAAIGIGAFIEGETILILGGFAAHRGYLELPWVIACALIGTLFGDQFYYHLGRIKGKSAIARRPRWKARSDKALALLDKHQVWLIIGFRFIYGLRTVTPFLIGASNVPPMRFLLLNMLGASIWSVTIGVLGYLFGDALQIVIGDIKKYELLVFVVIALTGAAIWLILVRNKHTANTPSQPTPKKPRDR